jgi:hypothetical protein
VLNKLPSYTIQKELILMDLTVAYWNNGGPGIGCGVERGPAELISKSREV